MRAALYARLSLDRDGTRESVPAQVAAIQKHVSAQEGWSLVGSYSESDVSAYQTRRRPEFERMLGDLDQIDVIVVTRSDRLYRRLAELERLIPLLDRAGVIIVGLRSASLDLSTADGRSIARLLGTLAQREVELLGERVSESHERRARRGEWGGGPRRLGYTADASTLVVHESDAIRDGYRAVDGGATLHAVSRDWQALGIKGTLGGTITPSSVRDVLLRPMNAGLRDYKGTIVAEAGSPAIVDRELWQRVVERLRANRAPGRRERTLLSGILTCGRCGSPMKGMVRQYPGDRSVPAYRCHGERHCSSRRRDTMDDLVAGAVLEVLERDREIIHANIQPAEVRDEIGPLREELAALGRMVAAGAMSAAVFAAAAGPLGERIATLESQPTGSPGAAVQSMLKAGDIRAAWDAALITVRRQVIKVVVANVTVQPGRGGAVVINWR